MEGQTFNGGGGAVMLTADEVNSRLTLNSTYHGTGQPVNTLKVTASNAAEARLDQLDLRGLLQWQVPLATEDAPGVVADDTCPQGLTRKS
jgi:hypothetical protein